MRALFLRDLLTIARTPGLWAAAIVHVVTIMAFVVVWGDGVPSVAGSVLQQFMAVQGVLLALILPWSACRCATVTRVDLVRLAAAMAMRPALVIAIKSAAVFAAALVVAAAALPVAVVTHRIASRSAIDLLVYVGWLAALCGMIAAVIVAWMLTSASRFGQWIGAGATVVVLSTVVPSEPSAIPALIGAAGVALVSVLLLADRRLRYIH
jgi:hypothetical protein